MTRPLFSRIAVYIQIGVLLTACGSSDSGSSGSSVGFVQLINGIEDSPALSIEITADDDTVETVSSFSFQQATSLLSLARDSYEVEVFYTDPDSGFDERLLSMDVDVARDSIYIGVLTGTFADAQMVWFEKDEGDVTDADSEQIEVVAINLSADKVSAYLGDDSDGTNAETLVATVAPGNASNPLLFTFNDDADYHLRLTPDGSTELIYDSDTINIADESRYTIVVTDTTGPDADRGSAFLVRDSGAQTYNNSLANAGFVVVNALADSTEVMTEVAIAATGDALNSATLSFPEATMLTTANPDFIDVEVVASTDTSVTYSSTVSLNEDTAYSFVVAGSSVDNDASVRANEWDLRRVANSVNLHFVNALRDTDDEDSSEVDFYALRLGDSLSDTTPLENGVAFLEGFSAVIGATPYDLVVTTTGTQSILAGPTRIFPEGRERMIVLATEAAGGGDPNQVVVVVND